MIPIEKKSQTITRKHIEGVGTTSYEIVFPNSNGVGESNYKQTLYRTDATINTVTVTTGTNGSVSVSGGTLMYVIGIKP